MLVDKKHSAPPPRCNLGDKRQRRICEITTYHRVNRIQNLMGGKKIKNTKFTIARGVTLQTHTPNAVPSAKLLFVVFLAFDDSRSLKSIDRLVAIFVMIFFYFFLHVVVSRRRFINAFFVSSPWIHENINKFFFPTIKRTQRENARRTTQCNNKRTKTLQLRFKQTHTHTPHTNRAGGCENVSTPNETIRGD